MQSDKDKDLQAKIGAQGWLQGQRQRFHKHTHTPACALPHQAHAGHSFSYVCWSYNFLSQQADEEALDGESLPLSKTYSWLQRGADPETIQDSFSECKRAVMHFYLKY